MLLYRQKTSYENFEYIYVYDYLSDHTCNFLSKLKQTNFILNFSYFCVKNNLLLMIRSSPIRISKLIKICFQHLLIY